MACCQVVEHRAGWFNATRWEKVSAMLRRALVLLTLLTVHAVAQSTSEPTPMAQAVAAITLKPNWQRIEMTEEKPTSYRLQLYYKPLGQRHSPIVSRTEATADTKEIAGAVLDELKKEGKDPAKDRISLAVWAQQDAGKGMTGRPLTRPFGRTVYNYKADRLDYRP
jgi:hypothetical protein